MSLSFQKASKQDIIAKMPEDQNQLPKSKLTSLLRKVPQRANLPTKFLPLFIIFVVVAAGIFSGLVLSSRSKSTKENLQKAALSEENLTGEQKQSFNQTFRDQAEGVIEKNDDFDTYAQGPWKLIRPGGESQTAYLTSSVMDLDEYIGKKVKVYGETFGSGQVAWLMDVGKVEVVN